MLFRHFGWISQNLWASFTRTVLWFLESLVGATRNLSKNHSTEHCIKLSRARSLGSALYSREETEPNLSSYTKEHPCKIHLYLQLLFAFTTLMVISHFTAAAVRRYVFRTTGDRFFFASYFLNISNYSA